MILAVDIGNTNTNIAIVNTEKNKFKVELDFRLTTEVGRTEDEYYAILKTLLSEHSSLIKKIKKSVVCSVVPQVTEVFSKVTQKITKREVQFIDSTKNYGMKINLIDPKNLGADRIVNALIARKLYGTPVFVIDFGTATTIDVVGKSGVYEGGIIAPGLVTSLHSLVSKTAKLPSIDFKLPKYILGRDTKSAMQSGMMHGYTALVDGLIEKLSLELKVRPKVVATGGLGKIIKDNSKFIQEYDEYLTVKGIGMVGKMG